MRDASIPDTQSRTYSQMPYYDPNARDMQIFVSEYSISTVLKTVVDSDYIKFTEYLNDDNINGIIPDFDAPFGAQDNVTLVIKTSPSSVFVPTVTIDQQSSLFNFEIEMHIMNPFDPSIDALVMRV